MKVKTGPGSNIGNIAPPTGTLLNDYVTCVCWFTSVYCSYLSPSDPVCAEWWVQSHETGGEAAALACEMV